MVLEMSKTEFVVPSTILSRTSPISMQISGKETTTIVPKSSVKWLGFLLEYVKIHNISLKLGSLAKLQAYVAEISPHVNFETFGAIFRSYVQSSLNYFYIPAKYIGGESLANFFIWEDRLRSIRDVNNHPKTADICQNQLTTLELQYPRSPYALR